MIYLGNTVRSAEVSKNFFAFQSLFGFTDLWSMIEIVLLTFTFLILKSFKFPSNDRQIGVIVIAR